jgi:hypothetical protein
MRLTVTLSPCHSAQEANCPNSKPAVFFLQERLAGVKKVAVFSTDNKPFYSFSTPFAAWAWKHRIGYTPIVLVPEDFHPFVASKIEVCIGAVSELLQCKFRVWLSILKFIETARIKGPSYSLHC